MARTKHSKVITSIVPRRYEFEFEEDEVITVLKKHLVSCGCKVPEGEGLLSMENERVCLAITEKHKRVRNFKEIEESEDPDDLEGSEDSPPPAALFSCKIK